jgi:hypothetical protein
MGGVMPGKPDIELICENCKEPFMKSVSEYTRQINKNPNYKFYCTKTCTGKAVNINNIKGEWGKHSENLVRGKPLDIYSPFREHIRRSKRRLKDVNITIYDLKNI